MRSWRRRFIKDLSKENLLESEKSRNFLRLPFHVYFVLREKSRCKEISKSNFILLFIRRLVVQFCVRKFNLSAYLPLLSSEQDIFLSLRPLIVLNICHQMILVVESPFFKPSHIAAEFSHFLSPFVLIDFFFFPLHCVSLFIRLPLPAKHHYRVAYKWCPLCNEFYFRRQFPSAMSIFALHNRNWTEYK